MENQVFIPQDNPNIVRKTMKTTDPFNIDNPNEVLYHLDTRISEHNATLGTTVPYTVVGFGRLTNGEFVVVTEQPLIHNARLATKEEISSKMEEMGYEESGKDSFGDENHYITDVNPKNVLVDEYGNLHFIDFILDYIYEPNEESIGLFKEDNIKRLLQEEEQRRISSSRTNEDESIVLSRMSESERQQYENAKDIRFQKQIGITKEESPQVNKDKIKNDLKEIRENYLKNKKIDYKGYDKNTIDTYINGATEILNKQSIFKTKTSKS